MATVVVGCDENSGDDKEWQDTVASVLEQNGHKVEKLPIVSYAFADYSYGNTGNPKGKISVYIMADSLVSVADLAFGGTSFKYAYFIIRGDLDRPRMKTWEHFKNNPIGRDPDCTSVCDKLAGKSYGEMNSIVKDKCQITFGRTPKEGADSLIKLMGGSTTDSSSDNSSASSAKDALKDVLYGWDGEAECFVRDDTVYIRKIPSPAEAKLNLVEGINIDLDSVSITDYNPSTVNILTTTFDDYELSVQDDYLIKRFGKIPSTVEMDNEIKELEDAKKFLQREWNKLKRDNGHSLEVKTYGDSTWKQGRWCRVYLPSFNIDDYMYVTKVSQEDSGEWDCNLTLVDYPPGFGEPAKTENDNENESENMLDTTDSQMTDSEDVS